MRDARSSEVFEISILNSDVHIASSGILNMFTQSFKPQHDTDTKPCISAEKLENSCFCCLWEHET